MDSGKGSDKNNSAENINSPKSITFTSPAGPPSMKAVSGSFIPNSTSSATISKGMTSSPPIDPPTVPTVPPLQGAWAKKLNVKDASAFHQHMNSGDVAKWPSLTEAKAICKKQGIGLQSLKQVAMEDESRFPWAAKMNPATRNLYRASEPEYLEDGTPKVTIPTEVMLHGIENQKNYILGQFYRCSPPSGGLIYAVFNKLWGRKCRITIRKLSETTYLFHVPDESSRNWVLQRGLWHVDDCLMFVAPWTPEASLDIPEIKTIPVWVTLKKIPNILYSIPGISHIASGLGAPMATINPWLDPINMGEAKILVEVELSKAFPSRIAAADESGFISMVDVEYAWLPANCSRCGQLGHKAKRCLQLDGSSTKDVGNTTTEEEIIVGREIVKDNSEQLSDSPTATGNVNTNSPATDQVLECGIASPVQLQVTLLDENSRQVESSPKLAENELDNVSAQPDSEKETQKESPKKVVSGVRTNKFAFLSYSEGDEPSSDSEEVSESEEENSDIDSKEFMSPFGQRILRERPVKPSAKAQAMVWQMVGRGGGNHGGRGGGNHGGRGNRGRGNRGNCG